jgi:ribosomal protein S18 acetylase RimI-like enzyme
VRRAVPSEIRTLEDADPVAFVELHNAAFADSPMPVALDEAALRTYLEETDVRPELSHAAWIDGAPVSFCLGGLRGERASIRGEGTLPGYRRRGLGRAVLEATAEEVSAVGARELGLEVMGENAPAIPRYESAGFTRVRRLLGWTLSAQRAPAPLRLEPLGGDEAAERIARWSAGRAAAAPWQLQPPTLGRLPALAAGEHAVAIGKLRGPTFWLYTLAVAPERRGDGLGRALLRSLGATNVVLPGLVPEEWQDLHGFMRALGARPERYWQWEMRRPLDQDGAGRG